MVYIELFLVIGIITIFSYILNNILYKYLHDYSTLTAAIIEEILKTYGGYLIAQILITHVIFGLVEAIIDVKNSGKKGIYPAIFSILGHGAFGYLTLTVFTLTENLFYSILSGIFAHIIYNSLVIGIVNNLTNNRP
ncbi:hypothetical protein SAMN02745227_01453 [Anaerobranca californiensis DSM 14826]|uniref:CAAX protease self-immunity n=1 Tax=Anaerobranca californiensis DSM 14826 TaxID=1120989 RepID=A0A1M6PIW3_9FIRM|nr:hypothetical protein [Anaerobranca californiensis]SHK07834.1 hypothetical protein SAMN02745227_01453 [Anaerobranca californiensis DSM 14826]